MTVTRAQTPTDLARPASTTVFASTPSHKSRREQKAAEPHVEAREQAAPGCFAQLVNQLFETVMTKLFGRDGRG